MKLKFLIGTFVFLVIINIVAVDTYLYYHMTGKSTEFTGNIPLNVPIRGSEDPLAMLNDKQRNDLREIMNAFRKSTGELNGRIRILDNEILNLIREHPNQKEKIDQNLKEISALRMEISKIAIDKIIETKSFLSQEQQEHLFAAIFRSKPNVPPPKDSINSPKERKFDNEPEPMPGRPDFQPPPEGNRLKKLSEKLELTKDQITQVDAILKSFQNKYTSLEMSKMNDPLKYQKQRKVIMDQEDAQIEKILTDAQKKKFSEMKQEGKERELKPNQNKESPNP